MLRNTLAGSKTVVSVSRNATVRHEVGGGEAGVKMKKEVGAVILFQRVLHLICRDEFFSGYIF